MERKPLIHRSPQRREELLTGLRQTAADHHGLGAQGGGKLADTEGKGVHGVVNNRLGLSISGSLQLQHFARTINCSPGPFCVPAGYRAGCANCFKASVRTAPAWFPAGHLRVPDFPGISASEDPLTTAEDGACNACTDNHDDDVGQPPCRTNSDLGITGGTDVVPEGHGQAGGGFQAFREGVVTPAQIRGEDADALAFIDEPRSNEANSADPLVRPGRTVFSEDRYDVLNHRVPGFPGPQHCWPALDTLELISRIKQG